MAANESVFNATPAYVVQDVKRDEGLANLEIATLAVILFLAIVGNFFVLVALWRQMRFRPPSRMYFFMMHLSIADLMVAIFSILPQLVWEITFRFRGGDVLCRAVKYLQIMVLYLSTYTLVMMAIDRYRAVCWTSNLHWNSLKLAKMMVLLAWLLSLVFAIPQPVIFRMTDIKNAPGVRDCWAVFHVLWGAKAYVTWFVLSAFVVPLIILSFCYGVICYRIWTYNPEAADLGDPKRLVCAKPVVLGTKRNGVNATLETVNKPVFKPRAIHLRRNGRKQISHSKLKTIKLTFIVIICFFVCWSPFCITQLVMVYNPQERPAGPIETIFLLLACLNSCTNPWIYLAFSGSLLNHLRVCIGIGTGRPRDNDSIGDEEPEPQKHKQRLNNHVTAPRGKMASTKSEVL